MNRFEMRERLENKLTKKRFEHSLGVEYVSGCLAMVHGADVNKALTAGLLHDCAKCLPAESRRFYNIEKIWSDGDIISLDSI